MRTSMIVLGLLVLASCRDGNREPAPDERSSVEPESRPETPTDAEALMKKLLAELGEGYIGRIEGPFIVLGNLPKERFDRIVERTVRTCSETMYRQYFKKKPDYILKVYLFAGDSSYRAMAEKLWDDTDISRYGYYMPYNKTLVMNISTGTGTLVHEMFHALAAPDFPEIPDWFNEGAASLYEQCNVTEDKLIGLMNWRFPQLRDAVKAGTHVSLAELVSTDSFYGTNSGLHYAEARYFCMYLQDKGLLEKFYRMFRDNYDDDPTGRKFIEKVLGKKIGEVEKDWLAYVKTLRYRR